jgi:hypothetical protein
MAKRKAEDLPESNGSSGKKRAVNGANIQSNFRIGLFDTSVLDEYTTSYAKSQP